MRAVIRPGLAPGCRGQVRPTFTAMKRAVQEHLSCSQNVARRLTREYLAAAANPSVQQLLDFAELNATTAPRLGYRHGGRSRLLDPTGEEVARGGAA